MTAKPSRLDPAFLERQGRRLAELRAQLLSLRHGREDEQAAAAADALGQAREYEDDAQQQDASERRGTLAAADRARLADVERALQKIADGTYGLSEAGGAAIAIERLEASPEALYTLEEQAAREPKAL